MSSCDDPQTPWLDSIPCCILGGDFSGDRDSDGDGVPDDAPDICDGGDDDVDTDEDGFPDDCDIDMTGSWDVETSAGPCTTWEVIQTGIGLYMEADCDLLGDGTFTGTITPGLGTADFAVGGDFSDVCTVSVAVFVLLSLGAFYLLKPSQVPARCRSSFFLLLPSYTGTRALLLSKKNGD